MDMIFNAPDCPDEWRRGLFHAIPAAGFIHASGGLLAAM
jgi:hypothetical protein